MTNFFFKMKFKECSIIGLCWSYTLSIIFVGFTALQTSGLVKKQKNQICSYKSTNNPVSKVEGRRPETFETGLFVLSIPGINFKPILFRKNGFSKPFLTWFLHNITYSMGSHDQVYLLSLVHTSLP